MGTAIHWFLSRKGGDVEHSHEEEGQILAVNLALENYKKPQITLVKTHNLGFS